MLNNFFAGVSTGSDAHVLLLVGGVLSLLRPPLYAITCYKERPRLDLMKTVLIRLPHWSLGDRGVSVLQTLTRCASIQGATWDTVVYPPIHARHRRALYGPPLYTCRDWALL